MLIRMLFPKIKEEFEKVMAFGEGLNDIAAPVVIDNGSSTCKASFAKHKNQSLSYQQLLL